MNINGFAVVLAAAFAGLVLTPMSAATAAPVQSATAVVAPLPVSTPLATTTPPQRKSNDVVGRYWT